MNKMWLVAQHEFLINIKKRSFLWGLIGAPLFTIGLVVLITFVSASAALDGEVAGEKVGYVDNAAILVEDVITPEGFQRFDSNDAARAALDAETIDSYFVIPANYLTSGKIELYAYGSTPEPLQDAIEDFMATHLAAQVDSPLSEELLRDPVNASVVMENTGRRIGDDPAAFLGLFLTPFIFMMIFMMATQITSTLIMGGVVEEKGNRIMELLITSLTPTQLLMGKLLGLGALGLVQLGVWGIVGFVGLNLGRDTAFLSAVVIPPDLVLLALVYFILNYFLYSSIYAGIGAITGSDQESRQYAGVISILPAIPLFVIFTFITDPNGSVPVLLTLIPFTSAISMVMRAGFTIIPPEQIILSIVIMLLTTVFIMWASAKIFRWALLLYGKRVTPRELWRVIRGSVETGTVAATAIQER